MVSRTSFAFPTIVRGRSEVFHDIHLFLQFAQLRPSPICFTKPLSSFMTNKSLLSGDFILNRGKRNLEISSLRVQKQKFLKIRNLQVAQLWIHLQPLHFHVVECIEKGYAWVLFFWPMQDFRKVSLKLYIQPLQQITHSFAHLCSITKGEHESTIMCQVLSCHGSTWPSTGSRWG